MLQDKSTVEWGELGSPLKDVGKNGKRDKVVAGSEFALSDDTDGAVVSGHAASSRVAGTGAVDTAESHNKVRNTRSCGCGRHWGHWATR